MAVAAEKVGAVFMDAPVSGGEMAKTPLISNIIRRAAVDAVTRVVCGNLDLNPDWTQTTYVSLDDVKVS